MKKYKIEISRLVYHNGSFSHVAFRQITLKARDEKDARDKVRLYPASTGACHGLEIAASDEKIDHVYLL